MLAVAALLAACGGGGPDPQFARWALELDQHLDFKQMVVWDKGPMGMGWHYRRSYETVLVAQKPGAACRWFDKTNRIENIIRHIPKIIPQAGAAFWGYADRERVRFAPAGTAMPQLRLLRHRDPWNRSTPRGEGYWAG